MPISSNSMLVTKAPIAMGLSNAQLGAIQIAERVSSVLSVMGCLFVIITYLGFVAFHKLINRLVFYASWGNLATNVATIVSRSGIAAGVNPPLCQLQGFIIHITIICTPTYLDRTSKLSI